MKKIMILAPKKKAGLTMATLTASRTERYRRKRLGEHEFLKRKRSAHQRTGSTRRIKHFVANRLDAILTAYRREL